MEVWAYLIDWDALQRAWPASSDEPYLGECIDDGADWITNDSYTASNDSAMFNSEIGDLYRVMEPKLEPPNAEALGTFLTAFSLSLAEDGSGKPDDLERESEVVLSSLSPDTVQRYLAYRERIDLDAALSVAEQAIAAGSVDLDSADELKEFIEMWTHVLQEARAQERGILVCAG